MKRVAPYLLLAALISGLLAEFWSYRNHHAAAAAAQFAPRAAPPAAIPAGTAIQAVVREGIPTFAVAGDTVEAFISDPVIVDGYAALAAGTQLNGVLKQVLKRDRTATVSMDFTSIVIDKRRFPIESERLVAKVPIATDFDIISGALEAVTNAGIGAAMGAATQTQDGVNMGLATGALRGASETTLSNASITVVLTRPLPLIS